MTTRIFRNQTVSDDAYANVILVEDFYEQANRKEHKRNMNKKKYAKRYVIQRLRQSDNR